MNLLGVIMGLIFWSAFIAAAILFFQGAKQRSEDDAEDLRDARAALEDAKINGTVPWSEVVAGIEERRNE